MEQKPPAPPPTKANTSLLLKEGWAVRAGSDFLFYGLFPFCDRKGRPGAEPGAVA